MTLHTSDLKTDALGTDCEESRLLLTRRHMLGVTASLFSAGMLPRWAHASATSPRMLFVVLRGGMDGLAAVIPHGDPNYERQRGDLALARSDTIRLNSFFSLHPALQNFGQWYGDGEALAVHAACVPLQNRSHFDCQDNLESGLAGKSSNPTGWLNRLLSVLPTSAPIRRAGAIEIGEAPLILRGPAPVLGWSPTWFTDTEDATTNNILASYYANDRPLYSVLRRGLRADALAERAGGGNDEGISQLRRGFRGAARLMRANGGPHIAVLSVGGFDTHSSQGVLDGPLHTQLSELDSGLADFRSEIGGLWSNTVVVCATEFGRSAIRNGDNGTDHGAGTVALLAGGAVNGRRVFADWPGLRNADLDRDKDLAVTTDLRSVFKGVLEAHLDVPASLINRHIFPDSRDAPFLRALIKSSPSSAQMPASAFGSASERAMSPLARYRRSL